MRFESGSGNFYKRGYLSHPYAFLCSNIVDSTFPHQPKAGGPSSLSREGTVLQSTLQYSFRMLFFNKRMFYIPPAKQEALHSLEPKACRPMNAKRSYRLKNDVVIFADSKQSLRPLPFLSRKELRFACFPFVSFCILAFSYSGRSATYYRYSH